LAVTLAPFGGWFGSVTGLAAAPAAEVAVLRLPGSARPRPDPARDRDLPVLLELAAVALRAGLAPGRALAVAADAVGGSLQAQIGRVAALSTLGAEPQIAWRDCADDPVLAPVARAVCRAGETGSAIAAGLDVAADEVRRDRVERTARSARRASVLAMLPLGLCFLPAFVAIGVVPVVVGVLRHAIA
ncbi:MAG: type II secretion system F family protein, partial [Mycobacteriales bacterium]